MAQKKEAASVLIEMSSQKSNITDGVCCQTDTSVQDIELLMTECQTLKAECQSLRTENIILKGKLNELSIQESDAFKNNNDKVKFFTGLPHFAVLMVIFNFVSPLLKQNGNLTKFQQVILTLMRLRLNISVQYLAYTFGVSASTISRTFNNVINIMYTKLVPALVVWPEREELRKSMPMSFRQLFAKCTCIIDCFEIFIERPSDLLARAITYSNYKSHNTVKYLIGIAPQGSIIFISKGWGGRTSDKHITEASGFLDKLLPGDLILADRGFNVETSVNFHQASLQIPAFTKGKKQLDPLDVESTRKIAKVRIHVERVIGATRQKYSMLESTIPINMLYSDSNNVTVIDKIVQVSCALTNCSESIVNFD